MAKRRIRRIYVQYSKRLANFAEFFTDWYEFADWLKQETLQGNSITIHSWEYK